MRKFLLLVLFFSVGISGQSQIAELQLNGKYFNNNIYILNPSEADSFSIKKIIVNGDTLIDELNSNAIEVDFQMLGLKNEQDISLTILYDSLFPPFIQNPEVLFPPEDLRFSKPRIRDNTLLWRVGGIMSDYPLEVQQLKWNQWRSVGEVDPLDTVEFQTYSLNVKLHSGDNEFRIKTVNFKEEEVLSKVAIFRPPNLMPVKMITTKISNEIEFSNETEYEIYGIDGNLLLKGFDRYVDVSSLSKGTYFVNFDNSTVEIKKK